jgi:hypothetical protein
MMTDDELTMKASKLFGRVEVVCVELGLAQLEVRLTIGGG